MVLAASNLFMYKMQLVSNAIILHLKASNKNYKSFNHSLAHNAPTWSFKTYIYSLASSLASFLALSYATLCLSNPHFSSLTPTGL